MVNTSIIRQFGTPPKASVLHAPDLSTLQAALPQAPKNWIVSDLSMGAWRSHQVAREFSEQLGLDPPTPESIPVSATQKDDDGIGWLVDVEGKGNIGALTAIATAERILNHVKGQNRLFLVIMPRFGFSWHKENLTFLRFFTQGVSQFDARILFVAGDDTFTPLPDYWNIALLPKQSLIAALENSHKSLLGLIPGIVDTELAQHLTDSAEAVQSLEISNGRMLVDPACRSAPNIARRLLYDRLAMVPSLPSYWKAYAQVLGNNVYVDPEVLITEAWRRFMEGGIEGAIYIMEKVIACAQNLELKGRFLWELQGMRIALQQFNEACAIADPSEALPTDVKAGLLQTKGWAFTILGNAKQGTAYLGRARELLRPSLEGTNQFLFLENIYALSRLKSGDYDDALRVEKSIEQKLADMEQANMALTYVNTINQARLYSIAKDFKTSLDYYSRAFETTFGVRTDSDHVYGHFCLARTFSSLGKLDIALQHWISCCLFWVSWQVPEGLAPRASSGMLKRRVSEDDDAVEAISEELFEHLLSATNAVSSSPVLPSNQPCPVFQRANSRSEGDRACVIGVDGWSVIVGHSELEQSYQGPKTDSLRALLFNLIQNAAPTFDWQKVNSIWVDDQFGRDIPSNSQVATLSAIRYGVGRIIFSRADNDLNTAQRERLEASLTASIGPAVSRIDHLEDGQLRISFKRYLDPVTLCEEDSSFMRCIQNKKLVPLTDINGALVDTIMQARRLEEAQLIILQT